MGVKKICVFLRLFCDFLSLFVFFMFFCVFFCLFSVFSIFFRCFLMFFSMFLERVLFGTLGAIRELMGGKVVPKGFKKCPKETILRPEWISENSGFTKAKP